MMIKLLPGNTGKSALVIFSKGDFLNIGLSGRDLTLQKRKTRLLLKRIFALLHEAAGLQRAGNYVLVKYRPVKDGGCRFLIEFTHQPSGRGFSFETEDDLLDALNLLRSDILSKLEITHSGEEYKLYIPSGAELTERELAVLNEYAM